MIPNITRGSRMGGLMVYLASTDADKTKNAHTNPHLVAGDAAIMAWYDDGTIGRDDALAIAKHLDQPHRKFGVEVLQKDLRWDEATKQRVDHGHRQADVWHCSLSLRAGERELTDQEWGDIANEFVDEMGFTEASGKAQCRWAAVNHGVSTNGNHHIHIAVSLVREDGTKASTHGDYRRAQKTCRELESKHGLEELSSVHVTRGYERAEPQTAVRNDREMYRDSLSRKVRAAATSSQSEAQFVRRGRDTRLLMRPRYEKGTTDVVVGYSVAERPPRGERPVWYGGGKLAGDLGLGQLRKEWPDTPQDATAAAAEWNAAARNKRQAAPETVNAAPTPELWEKHTQQAKALADQLREIPPTDHATWAKAARQASGTFAAWSVQFEQSHGPLAATAAELSKTAQLRNPREHSKPVALPSLAGSAMLLMAANGKSKPAAQTAMMVQLMRTARAVYDMHNQSGRLRESQHLYRVLTTELAPFSKTMPALVTAGPGQAATATVGTPGKQAEGRQLTAAELAGGDFAATRAGSVVPSKTEPAKRYQPTKPEPDKGYGR